MSQNTHQTTSLSKSTRGRKPSTVPNEIDYTGSKPFMNIRKRKAQKRKADYKQKQHLFAMVERRVEIYELARDTDEHATLLSTSIGKQEFARMTTEQLRNYAKLFAMTIIKIQVNTSARTLIRN